jgi:Asp-tRNA(Asn)/Glu-tRNA(Gln) amidotransferase C subunit|tara:strand:- start:429 stop:686 length:258 start_codon:yes stop_codon:yes gene_type:complete
MDFLFHKVSEEEKEDIKKQAKSIMENFSEKLSKVDDKIPEPLIERDDFERVEGEGKDSDSDFKERIFENAPRKNNDFILSEKKKW